MTGPIGALDACKADIIEVLKTDSVLAKAKFYNSMFEVDSNTRKPCHSIDLGVDKDNEDGYTGRGIDNYVVSGVIITYLEPDTKKTKTMPSLDEYRERTKTVLKRAAKLDTFSVIKSFKYLNSYTNPMTTQTRVNGMVSTQLTAHRAITEFEITYEVRDI